ncbi:MAG TPA: hypothetical protein EYQ26_14425 [Rhodospirillales bacterium]|nr:hypothetical protein [Rhodospirillales bacterium]
MPKRYFQMIPAVDYDVDGDGTTKVAIDILRRVKLRAESLLDGAIFYNYQMQDSDNAEIIADKYYGSSQYHWVVLMMNNILDHTYDLTLNDNNFEGYINTTYGSYPRASGLSINLTSFMPPTNKTMPTSGIRSETYPTEVTFEARSYDPTGNLVSTSASGNTGITSGSFPAGNTTAIWIFDMTASDPFKNIGIGDTVNLFVPEIWYDQTTGRYQSGTITGTTVTTTSFDLASDASIIPNRYEGGSITITSEGTGTTGITGNTRIISTYDSVTKTVTIVDPFLTIPVASSSAAWSYTVTFNAAQNFPLISYTSPAKVVAKSTYRDGDEQKSAFHARDNPNAAWIPDSDESDRYFKINVETDSTTFEAFSWDKTRDLVSIQTGIHHFERDIYDDSGSTLLAEKIWITQEQYVNASIGTASTKRIVSNLDYEAEANEEKRTIQLLKRDYLDQFVEEFKTLMKLGV